MGRSDPSAVKSATLTECKLTGCSETMDGRLDDVALPCAPAACGAHTSPARINAGAHNCWRILRRRIMSTRGAMGVRPKRAGFDEFACLRFHSISAGLGGTG